MERRLEPETRMGDTGMKISMFGLKQPDPDGGCDRYVRRLPGS